jgi:hypothetical protein
MESLKRVNLPNEFTSYLEQNYYSKITELSTLEAIINDPEFLKAPLKHVALFSDHGIQHGRDIANKIIQVLHQVNGLLIPARDCIRLEFMVGYGVMLAYLHDIGLKNYSAFGRAIHPEFAAQLVFTKDFDRLIDALWQENSGGVPWRLLNLSVRGLLPQNPQLVLRELLSMSMCHSKSKVPIDLLNDVQTLRKTMQVAVGTELHYLYHLQHVAKAEKQLAQAQQQDSVEIPQLREKLNQARTQLQQFVTSKNPVELLNENLQQYYQDCEHESFTWLTSTQVEVQALVLDVIDTQRVLRCADAFRERGTAFKTSAGYEVLVNPNNAHAVYVLRSRDRKKLFHLEGKDPISAGEANMSGADLDQDGNLRVSFACGSFSSAEALQWGAFSAAVVINDIQADVIASFRRPPETPPDLLPPRKLEQHMKILIEDTADNLEFAELVCEQLLQINPALLHRVQPVVSLQGADITEVKRYLSGMQPNWNMDEKRSLLNRIAQTGHKVDQMDLENAFNEVKVIRTKTGEVLIENGSPSWFVYIPFSEGLRVFPSGTPVSQSAIPWEQIGSTGVIRCTVHHVQVVAERDVTLLMIPKQIYLKYWYRPYSVQEFTKLCLQQSSSLISQPQDTQTVSTIKPAS